MVLPKEKEADAMRIETTTDNRKNVVKAIEEATGLKAKYQGPPTFAYIIGDFTIDREGNVEIENEEEALRIKSELASKGLAEMEADALNIKIATPEATPEGIKNLFHMIHSKQYLLEKAIGIRVLEIPEELIDRLSEDGLSMESIRDAVKENPPKGIEINEDSVEFTDLPFTTEKARAYTKLFSAMTTQALKAKRVSADETIEENEKYYMRVWLVRLGFGGKDGKEVREELLRNLKGHTAFRTPEDAEKWKEKYGKKKA